MPDFSHDVVRSANPLTLLEQDMIRTCLDGAMRGIPDAAVGLGLGLSRHIDLAFFRADAPDQAPSEAVLMGHKVGTLFIGGEHRGDPLRGQVSSIFCRSAFGGGVAETSIEVSQEDYCDEDELNERVQRFLARLEQIMQSQPDIIVNRAYPTPSSEPVKMPSGNFRPGWLNKGAIAIFVLLAVSCLLFFGWRGVHSNPIAPARISMQALGGTTRAKIAGTPQRITSSQTSSKGLNGITVVVGGYGSGDGPNLQAFGIKPGPEVATPDPSGN